MSKFFCFKTGELLERSKNSNKYVTSIYGFSNIYVNVNRLISVHKFVNDTYKIFIGDKEYYIKEETFKRLKAEVLDAK